ncbi:MAG: NUDIX domain-containing protein [Clostridiales bacterium]|nr:NUDIX domain-containing protein [Clostridiales bacterium]
MSNHNVAEKHPPEKAIFMNMCMLCDGDMVLALDKTGSNYSGTTFPGGHVEAGETFSEAVIREMQEETGLTIKQPILKGIYHWYRDGLHNVGLLYRADSYEGELKSSEEGQVADQYDDEGSERTDELAEALDALEAASEIINDILEDEL